MKSYQPITIFVATAVLLGLLTLPSLSFAVNGQQPMSLFKGLQFVHVTVPPLDEKAKNRGFDARGLGKDTERQLQKAGIKILSTEEYDRVRMSKSYPVVRLEMSVSIEVNPNTVMRTYSYLQDMGIIFNKRGIGYFVADHAYEKTLDLKKRNFLNRELPHVFRTMDLLSLTFDDLEDLYRKGS